MPEENAGIKLIRHNVTNVDLPDDQSLPFKLEISLGPDELVKRFFVMLYGNTEEIILRSPTQEALESLIESDNLRTFPRLLRFTMTGPNGTIEQFTRE